MSSLSPQPPCRRSCPRTPSGCLCCSTPQRRRGCRWRCWPSKWNPTQFKKMVTFISMSFDSTIWSRMSKKSHWWLFYKNPRCDFWNFFITMFLAGIWDIHEDKFKNHIWSHFWEIWNFLWAMLPYLRFKYIILWSKNWAKVANFDVSPKMKNLGT